ncbi:hypothetical protein V8G54_021970 [Vigna mungo]|uniref:Uncharacterized protein n=1 Tax=Vigna mungo TaxID=3915 RepID=A0AAQ3NEC3_VIGMU
MFHSNSFLVTHIVALLSATIIIFIRVQSEVCRVLHILQFSTERRVPRGNRVNVDASSVSGANKGEEANKNHHYEREVAIELKRGYGPGPMILRVPLAPQRVVPSAYAVQRAPLGHPAREEGEAHLEKPCSVKNQAHAAAQFGNT